MFNVKNKSVSCAHLTPHELHWNEVLNRRVVAFLSLCRFVANSPPNHKVDPSNYFGSNNESNQPAQCCPAFEPKFGKDFLLIITIWKFSWFWHNIIRLKHLTVQNQRYKNESTHLLNKFIGFTTTDHKIIFSLINLFSLFLFHTPWKNQDDYGSLMFSGCANPGTLERDS